MSDQKEEGSNAYWWTRLKKPDTLQPYLRIAEGLKIIMPLVPPDDYEYDPNAKPMPPMLCHADTQHVSTYSYLKDTKYFPHTPRVEITRPHVPLFFKPWNGPWNITRARNIIAEHLARNELSLQGHIKDCDLLEEPKYESKSDVYSWEKTQSSNTYWNDWNNVDTNASSWKENWWKDPNERTAWHSKTVSAMRARSATALKEQEAVREQADIIARLNDVTLETPNDQINDMLSHLNRDLLRTRRETMFNGSGRTNRGHEFIDDSLLVDNDASAAYNHIKSLDSDDDRDLSHSDDEPNGCVSDASGHYNESDDSDDSRHFDHANRTSDADASGIYMADHERHRHTAYPAQSWTGRFEEINRENDGLYDNGRSAKTRADRYAAWQKMCTEHRRI